jgi:hypothetical protein
VVHTIFFQMCGVEESGSKVKRTKDLCEVAPLESGAAFEVVDEKETWHPVWKGKIDDTINVEFIKAVVGRIWENEQVSTSIYVLRVNMHSLFVQRIRNARNGKGEISDADFTTSAITDCVKTYWRNIHKQFMLRRDPKKYGETLDASRLRARRQGVSTILSLS